MNFNILFSILTAILIVFSVFLKGRALEKLFYLFVLNILIIILLNKGIPLALLYSGTIIPLITRNNQTMYIKKQEKGSNRSVFEKVINYLSFAPLIGLGVMSYKIPQFEIGELSPVMIILGEVSVLVVTVLVISPKRLRLR